MKKQKRARLIEGNVTSTLIKLTIPMIFGMVGMVIFNLVDTFYVGKLGAEHLAALSFTFPVIMVLNGFSIGIGLGTSALVSRFVGANEHKKAEWVGTDALILGFLLALFAAIFGLIFARPLFTALGAKGQILTYTLQYMYIWFPGAIFVVFPMIGNNIIRSLGDTTTPGIIMLISAAINALLDPLLIFGIWIFPELGIRGAAIATVFARALTMFVALYVLSHREHIINLRDLSIARIKNSWKEILHIGIPNAGILISLPIGVGIVTRILAGFGSDAVAGFGVASRIEFFAMAPIAALASVMGPFIGQNLGAKKFNRITSGRITGEVISMIIGLGMAIILAIFARPIAAIFADKEPIKNVTALYLFIVPFTYGFNGVARIASTILNVLKKPLYASALMAIQVFIIYIPFAFIGAKLFQTTGVFWALSLSYIITGIIAHFVIVKQLSKVKKS